MRRAWWAVASAGLVTLPSACGESAPSTLDVRGPGASTIASLWWLLLGLGSVVLVAVVVLLLLAVVRQPAGDGPGVRFVAVTGIVLPAAILLVVLWATISTGARTYAPPTEPALTVTVTAHQFWWEVRYDDAGVVTANEIHVPVGVPVRLELRTADVIHAFWVPQLHGKRDMVPGAENQFWVQADEPGEYRGICAEFCGVQHARMHFLLVATPPEEFDRWLADQQGTAAPAGSASADQGRALFETFGCAACHTVRGVSAETSAGPDLTRLATRLTIAAGMRPNERDQLRSWILDPQTIKPGVRMPATALDDAEVEALLDFLEGLR